MDEFIAVRCYSSLVLVVVDKGLDCVAIERRDMRGEIHREERERAKRQANRERENETGDVRGGKQTHLPLSQVRSLCPSGVKII